MNSYFSEWIQSVRPDISGTKVASLWKGVETVAQKIAAGDADFSSTLTLCRWTFGLPEIDDARRTEEELSLRAAMKTAESTFPARNNDLEMRILAGAVVSSLMDNLGKADAVSLACLCAGLGVKGDEGVDQLLQDLAEQAKKHIEKESRRMRNLQSAQQLKIVPAHAGLSKTFEKAKPGDTVDVEWAKNVFVSLTAVTATISKLTDNIDQVNARVAQNQDVLQEELNILWWIVGGSSLDLKSPFDEIEALALPLIVGKEMAQLTRFVPRHPAAEKFLEGAMTSTTSELVRIVDAVQALPVELRRTWNSLRVGGNTLGSLCAISKALTLSCEIEGNGWVGTWQRDTGLDENHALAPLELAMRFSDELLLYRATTKSG